MYSNGLNELFRRGFYDCIFHLNGTVNNTMSVVQLIFADLHSCWIDKNGDELESNAGDTHYQYAINELEGIMKKKSTEEVFQLLGDFTMSDISESKECLFWFIEYYILTNIHPDSLRKHYSLLAKIALAYSELGRSPIIKVIFILIIVCVCKNLANYN